MVDMPLSKETKLHGGRGHIRGLKKQQANLYTIIGDLLVREEQRTMEVYSVLWSSFSGMESVTRVQIQDGAVYISLHTNALMKGMNFTVYPLVMNK